MIVMTDVLREVRFLFRQKSVAGLLLLAAALSTLSIITGLAEIGHQRTALARMIEADLTDRNGAHAKASDWGGAAYNSFHLTYAPPSDLAFAAIGQRDAAPWKHRIHVLALEGQIHAADTANPELALAGRVDFAFVASVLAPLFVILLLHDLRSSERAAGRHDLLVASAGHASGLWRLRAGVLVCALALCLLLPFWLGTFVAGTALFKVGAVTLVVCAHLLLWAGISYFVAARQVSGAVSLTGMVGAWLLLTAIVPAVTKVTIDRFVHLPSGGDIVLTQREAVNDAWDLPKPVTMDAFLARHPEWQAYTEVKRSFEWKWYYAFQQVGDQTAEPLSIAYREGILARDRAASFAALLSPPSLVERFLQRLAETDTQASQAYDTSVRAFHASLRNWYYPKLFTEEPFDNAALANLPGYEPVQR